MCSGEDNGINKKWKIWFFHNVNKFSYFIQDEKLRAPNKKSIVDNFLFYIYKKFM